MRYDAVRTAETGLERQANSNRGTEMTVEEILKIIPDRIKLFSGCEITIDDRMKRIVAEKIYVKILNEINDKLYAAVTEKIQ